MIKKSLLAIILLAAAIIVSCPDSCGQEAEAGYIDVHLHLDGTYRMGGPRGHKVTDYEVAADYLIYHMDKYGVAKALIMPPPQIPGQEVSIYYWDLLDVVKRYPKRFLFAGGGGVLNRLIHYHGKSSVRPEDKAEFKKEAGKIIQAGAKAFGEMAILHLSLNPRHVFEEVSPIHPLFLLLADLAADYEVPIDIHMEAVPKKIPLPAGLNRVSDQNPSTLKANINAFEHLLAHNRRAKIVWQHIGWDNTQYMTIWLLRRLLKEHPNLYLALRVEEREYMLGSNKPMPNRIVDKDWKIRPKWLKFFKDFPDRFMIGTDEFMGIPSVTRRRPQSFEETWIILDQLPPSLAKKIGRTNAERIYKIK